MKKVMQILTFFPFLTIFLSCGTAKSVSHQPQIVGYNQDIPVTIKHSDTLFSSGKNYLIKNRQQLWELYVSGDALQRGLITGSVAENLVHKQESVFFLRVKEIIPSKFKQKFLRQFLKWYNRKLYLHVPEEYQTEIYGISQYTSDEYDAIAPNYLRTLYLHGVHDIGHALQDLELAGCSSFAVWGDKSADGSLLIGRNMDFYAGDVFAEDKMISFVTPDKGYPFMSVGWGGMIGVLSGMNKEGLTVTINAGKSKIPLIAKTPISILAREILQYAATIDEAIAIAKSKQVFVSESIMIGSAHDKKAVLIEISPDNLGIYEVKNSNQLVCTNHFQSDVYKSDERNNRHILESHSKYRLDRINELLAEKEKITPMIIAEILRNKDGLHNLKIGYGNEKALNQLLAHHSVIFKPEQRMVWVSSNPYQLGEFVCYDLNKIFGNKPAGFVTLESEELNIPKDDFINTEAYKSYEKYRILDREFDKITNSKENLKPEFIKEYQSANPDYWLPYYKTGMYFYKKGWYKVAEAPFQKALSKEITTLPEKHRIEGYLNRIKKNK